jgi:hypothetical protein
MACLCFAPSDTDGQSLHGKIVKDALSATLNQANLDLVIRSLDQKAIEQTKEGTLPQGPLFSQQSFKSSVAFVDREQKKVLNYAAEADVSPASRYHCLKHFGQLLLVAQDFYSRSNYVEVEWQRLTEKFGESGFDPYNIELIDWNKLNNATKQNQPVAFGAATEAKESQAQGKAVLGSTTYYKAARELAVRETGRQWQVLETLIKQRYHDRAVTILAALKQASCPATEPDDLD